jgi:hypothetical protein
MRVITIAASLIALAGCVPTSGAPPRDAIPVAPRIEAPADVSRTSMLGNDPAAERDRFSLVVRLRLSGIHTRLTAVRALMPSVPSSDKPNVRVMVRIAELEHLQIDLECDQFARVPSASWSAKRDEINHRLEVLEHDVWAIVAGITEPHDSEDDDAARMQARND